MTNTINPAKLLNSKWTAVNPVDKEKHFIITDVEYDNSGAVISCVIEAVLTKKQNEIDWKQLKDQARWQHGWH